MCTAFSSILLTVSHLLLGNFQNSQSADCRLGPGVKCRLMVKCKLLKYISCYCHYRLLTIIRAIQANCRESLHSGYPEYHSGSQAQVSLFRLALVDGNVNTIRLKSLQSAVCILPSVYILQILPLVCSPQSAFYTDRLSK